MKIQHLEFGMIIIAVVVLVYIISQRIFERRVKKYIFDQLVLNDTFLEAFENQKKVNEQNLKFKESQQNFNKIHFKDTLIFSRYNRIPILDLIIEDCIKHEQYEIAEYWKQERDRVFKESKSEFKRC